MDFEYTPKVEALRSKLLQFMDDHIYPNEKRREQELTHNARDGRPYATVPLMEELKEKARAAGLWNLFLPDDEHGAGLTNLEYAPLCEIMGRRYWCAEAFNCNAPDTGNMEVLARYGTKAQQERWLAPMLRGEIRSSFAMTEPAVASSDATNIECSIRREGDDYVINGRKWYITGAMNERCEIFVLMGKTDPDNADRHKQQSMILVPKNTPGVTLVRDMALLGVLDPPFGHPEVLFENVRVPASNMLLGEGRGFEIAQGRLGPGRIHHCMRMIGMAEAALEMMCQRVVSRVAFHKRMARAHRQRAHAHRPDALDGAAHRGAHGYGGQQGGRQGDRDDQGVGAQQLRAGDRRCHAGLRRGGPEPGHLADVVLCLRAASARGGRAGRGASQCDCEA